MNDLIKRIDGWQYDVPADVKLHALLMDCKAALEAKGEPLCYITQAALDALIAEIDAIHPHPFQGNTLNRSEVIAILDKYRSAK